MKKTYPRAHFVDDDNSIQFYQKDLNGPDSTSSDGAKIDKQFDEMTRANHARILQVTNDTCSMIMIKILKKSK